MAASPTTAPTPNCSNAAACTPPYMSGNSWPRGQPSARPSPHSFSVAASRRLRPGKNPGHGVRVVAALAGDAGLLPADPAPGPVLEIVLRIVGHLGTLPLPPPASGSQRPPLRR